MVTVCAQCNKKTLQDVAHIVISVEFDKFVQLCPSCYIILLAQDEEELEN